MPLTDTDWRRIQSLINNSDRKRPEYFSQDKVIAVDQQRNVVFVKSYGDQAIPIYSFEYDVNYIDTVKGDRIKARHTIAKPRLPKKGDTILIARHMGSGRLPKCLGILLSNNFVELEG